MIDLHSHILPGCDDGARDLRTAIAMARIAVSDGVRIMACTPHIMPGLYNNETVGIRARIDDLQKSLVEEGIGLKLVMGADVHVAPDLVDKLKAGVVPTLHGSRYFLLEPPHAVVPPNFEKLVQRLLDAGYVPVLTHPERLSWAVSHYAIIDRVNRAGCLMQITASSVIGGFGARAQTLALRMLDERRVDIIASDGHGDHGRIPGLSKVRQFVSDRYGSELAETLVLRKPAQILKNEVVEVAVREGEGASSVARKPRTRSVRLGRFVEWIKNA